MREFLQFGGAGWEQVAVVVFEAVQVGRFEADDVGFSVRIEALNGGQHPFGVMTGSVDEAFREQGRPRPHHGNDPHVHTQAGKHIEGGLLHLRFNVAREGVGEEEDATGRVDNSADMSALGRIFREGTLGRDACDLRDQLAGGVEAHEGIRQRRDGRHQRRDGVKVAEQVIAQLTRMRFVILVHEGELQFGHIHA